MASTGSRGMTRPMKKVSSSSPSSVTATDPLRRDAEATRDVQIEKDAVDIFIPALALRPSISALLVNVPKTRGGGGMADVVAHIGVEDRKSTRLNSSH